MEMNPENMYLLALVETLKKENDALKEENVAVLTKLESAEDSISRLKTEILVMKETEKNHLIVTENNNLKHQLEISKIRKRRNKAFNVARRLQSETDEQKEMKKKIEKKIFNVEKDAMEKVQDIADKLAQVSEQKRKEVKTWQTKYEKLNKTVEDHNKQFDKKGFQIKHQHII